MIAEKLWFIYALTAAVLWGVGYVLAEKLLKGGIGPAFLMFASGTVTLPLYFLLALYLGQFKSGIEVLLADNGKLILVIVSALTVLGGTFLVFLGISEKNATLVNLIEISYPFFTFIFAWLILREVQLSWETAVGGLLIFSGITLIFLKASS